MTIALLNHFLPSVRMKLQEPYDPMVTIGPERQSTIQLHQRTIGVDLEMFGRHLQEGMIEAIELKFCDLHDLLLLQRLQMVG